MDRIHRQNFGNEWDRPVQRTHHQPGPYGPPRRPPLPDHVDPHAYGRPNHANLRRPPPAAAARPPRRPDPRMQPVGYQPRMPHNARPMPPPWPLPGPVPHQRPPMGSHQIPNQYPQASRRMPPQNRAPTYHDRAPAPELDIPPVPQYPPANSHYDDHYDGHYEGYDDMPVDAPVEITQYPDHGTGNIPVHPVPAANMPPGSSKRGAALGPPPSSRRGQASFYPTAANVPPIPEESPRPASRASFASSAAMPEEWRSISPENSTQDGDSFIDDIVSDRESMGETYGDESQLVRSASVVKRGVPALVNTRPSASDEAESRPAPVPLQPLDRTRGFSGTSSLTSSSTASSSANPMSAPATRGDPPPDVFLKAYAAASSTDALDTAPHEAFSLSSSRLSNAKRPPKLDIEAVRTAEARGSLTSLTDLIKRATTLVTMIDKGKRPGSRMNDLAGYFDEKGVARDSRGSLTDMLDAFPPPVKSPQNNSKDRSSWPTITDSAKGLDAMSPGKSSHGPSKRRRTCCGLPIWAFILSLVVIVGLLVTAIVVPVEYFVLGNLGNSDDHGKCQKTLPCLNGGFSVMSQGTCSCICTSGFLGATCGSGGNPGCTTTNLEASDGSSDMKNVTLGMAVPRLIAEANTNYSVSLSGSLILAKINSASLSCVGQNSLVTFNGQMARAGQSSQEVANRSIKRRADGAMEDVGSHIPRVAATTVEPSSSTVMIFPRDGPNPAAPAQSASSDTASNAARPDTPSKHFVVTEEMVDFARVAVLYILQEKNLDAAAAAQNELQKFLTSVSATRNRIDQDSQSLQQSAAAITLGGGNTVNLISFSVDVGKGPVGRKNA